MSTAAATSPVTLVLSPRACDDAALRNSLAALGADAALTVVPCETDDALRASLLELLSSNPDRLLLGGGDGSLHHALQLVLAHEGSPAVGLVPSGTANDAVRGLGLPDTPGDAIDAYLLRPQRRAIDMVCVNDRWMLNVLSIGTPAAITRETPQPLKQLLGGLAYVAYGLPRLAAPTPFSATVEVGDERWSGRAFAIYVGNLPYAGHGFAVCPQADPTDGLLDITIVPEQSLPQMWSLAGDAVFGGDEPDYGDRAEFYRGRTARIVLGDEVPVSLDGEALDQTELHLEVHPAALSLLQPPREA